MVLSMPQSKAQQGLPKGWPSGTTYLQAPSYSRKLSPGKAKALIISRTDVHTNVAIYKINGPYSCVRITPVTDHSHPANGQHGLFTTQNIPPDTLILPYLGYVHDETDIDIKSDYDLSLDRELRIGVDATHMGNEARFINDYRGVATGPNAEFRDICVDSGSGKVEKRVGVFVLSAGKSGKRAKGIKRGQEILVSYGKGFWTERQEGSQD